ncbi:hypothetical protein ACHAWF_017024 [Thalassiosira exigua]
MAPSSRDENANPQLRRAGGGVRRPSAVATQNPMRKATGIERSYDALARNIPLKSPRDLISPTSRASSRGGSRASRGGNGRGGGSRGGSRGSAGGARRSGGGNRGGSSGSTTGIERSYDSVARTIRSVASASGGGSGDASRVSNGSGATRSTAGTRTTVSDIDRAHHSNHRRALTRTGRVSLSSRSSASHSTGTHGSGGRGGEGGGGGPRPPTRRSASVGSRSSRSRSSDGRSGAFSNRAPPAPGASGSFDDGSHRRDARSVHRSVAPSVGHSADHSSNHSVAPSVAPSVAHSAIGAHLQAVSTSLSHDEYEKLKGESRKLREAHEARYGGASVASARASGKAGSKAGGGSGDARGREGGEAGSEGGRQRNGSQTSSGAGNPLSHSTATALRSNKARKASRESHGTYATYDPKLGKGISPVEPNKGGKEGAGRKVVSKLRNILHVGGTEDANDEMSFFCSDDAGTVTKQKVSLEGCEDGATPHLVGLIEGGASCVSSYNGGSYIGDVGAQKDGGASRALAVASDASSYGGSYGGGVGAAKSNAASASGGGGGGDAAQKLAYVAHDKRAGVRVPPQSPKYAGTAASKNGSKQGSKKAAGPARTSVGRKGVDVAPRVSYGAGAANGERGAGGERAAGGVMGGGAFANLADAARETAAAVAKATREGVEGLEAAARDLANAKTPARSNVTRNQGDYHTQKMLTGVQRQRGADGTYRDYVCDPQYKVVATPTPADAQMQPRAGSNGQPFGADPRTPACLLGAVAAGRCNLPEYHPESLEFLPEGIPRILVVHGDWEERAGFVPIEGSAHEDNASGRGDASVGGVSRNGRRSHDVDERRRESIPIDLDEETETYNGEEYDEEEMLSLRRGQPISATPRNGEEDSGLVDNAAAGVEELNGGGERNEEAESGDDEDDENDPRNASMWVAVPDNIDDDDDEDLLEKTFFVNAPVDDDEDEEDEDLSPEEVNIGELLQEVRSGRQDEGKYRGEPIPINDVNGAKDLADLAKDYTGSHDLITPTFSVGSTNTFFVGDLHLGSPLEDIDERESEEGASVEDEKKQEEKEKGDDNASRKLLEDAKSWTPTSSQGSEEAVPKALPAKKIEDLDATCRVDEERPQAAGVMDNDRDSLESLAKATSAAVVADERRKLSEFKSANKQVLFNVASEGYAGGQELYPNPSLSTDLTHEPPVRMVHGVAPAQQELYSRPSESTDLSQLSNWGAPAKSDGKTEGDGPKAHSNGKRQLKGRVILVRIKKKISKVARKMLFLKSKKKGNGADVLSLTDGASFVVSLPRSNIPIPSSPASPSVASITSSIVTGSLASASKRIIGAVPPKSGSPTPQQTLYGAINYGGDWSRCEESTAESDALPPPPPAGALVLRPTATSHDEEDAVSYLAEVMRRARSKDYEGEEEDANDVEEEEDSVLLLVTPKEDGTEEISHIVSGTPTQVRDVLEAVGTLDSDDEGDAIAGSDVKPHNLACLFADENGMGVLPCGTPVQIVDAVEVDGDLVLTPQGATHDNVAGVFRPSTGAESAGLLPGSVIDSDDEEDETLLYHDGQTVVRQTETFGDETIATLEKERGQGVGGGDGDEASLATRETAATKEGTSNGGVDDDIGTPILTPDGHTLSSQAAANGSFLFSPDNMGRAGAGARARLRASSKDGKVPPSITMLPATKTAEDGDDNEGVDVDALAIRKSYSYDPSCTSTRMVERPSPSPEEEEDDEEDAFAVQRSVSFDPSLTRMVEEAAVEEIPEGVMDKMEVLERKEVMASMTEDRLFSFNSMRSKFSTADLFAEDTRGRKVTKDEDAGMASSQEDPSSTEHEVETTPVVTNAADKKKYPATPIPRGDASVDPVQVAAALNAAPSPMSSASVSSSSIRSPKNKKKPSPKHKSVPKSALRTRKGFVKDRVSDIQECIDPSAGGRTSQVTDVGGRLKRNHSYRHKNPRRMTRGNGVLAPRKATLQTTYIRSVPIGIAKSYSRDSASIGHTWSQEEGFSIGKTCSQDSHGSSLDREEGHSMDGGASENGAAYVSKYTKDGARETKQRVSFSNGLAVSTEPVESFDDGSPGSVRVRSISSASSYRSETTDCDPFSSILGKMSNEDDESSSGDEEDVGGRDEDEGRGPEKENSSNVVAPSPSAAAAARLPFKSGAASNVKPTELNQHEERAPLSPVPMRAQKWRAMAAQHHQSSRFRSEKSWRDISSSL